MSRRTKLLLLALFTLIVWMGIVYFSVNRMVVYHEVEMMRPIKATDYDKLALRAPAVNSQDPILKLINDSRTQEGLPKLTISEQLMSSAKLKAEDMVKGDYWSHTSPDGITPWHWFDVVGYNYIEAGENLARGFDSNWTLENNGWLNSPSHRAVIMGTFTEFGYYVTKYDNGVQLVVTHFGRK